jgi:hypothetical protein
LLLPRRLALLEVALGEFLPRFVELTLLPKRLGLLVPMWASLVSHLTQQLLLPKRLALLEVALGEFLLSWIELRLTAWLWRSLR